MRHSESRATSYAIAVLLSVGLVVLGDRLIVQISSEGIFGDALVYTQMAKGDMTDVSAPFKYRILVPSLAWLLPFSATASLKIVSYIGLFFFYVLSLICCRRIQLSYFAAVVGLLAVFSSVWHLYNYQNPYLTDTFTLMLLCLMVLLVLSNSYGAYLTAIIFGILARETTIFLVPVWLATKQWRKAATAIGIALLVLLITRLILSSPSDLSGSVMSSFSNVDRMAHLLAFVRPGLVNWGFVGILTVLGLLFIPHQRFWVLFLAVFLLSVGAVVSSFLATDVGRMIGILSPMMVISCAQLVEVLARRSIPFTSLLVVAIVAQMFWVPTSITSRESWIFTSVYPRLSLGVIEILLLLAIVFVLKRDLLQAAKEKRMMFTSAIKNRI